MSEAAGEDRAFIERAVRIGITGIAVLVVLMAVLYVLKGALTPLAVSFAIAYFLDPVVLRLERLGIRRRLGVLLLLALALLALALFAFVLMPALVSQFSELAKSLPASLDAALAWLIPRVESFGFEVPATWTEAFQALRARFDLSALGPMLTRVLGSVAGKLGAVVGLLVIPVITFYMLSEFDRVKWGMVSMIPPRHREAVLTRWARVADLLSGFVRGQLTVCLMLSVLYALGFWALGVPLALLIGLIAGAIAFIPYVGSATALVLAALLCVFEYGIGLRLAAVVGWYLLVQNLEGLVLTPRIVGSSVGLHPMTVIVALLIGGNLLGFLGLLVAVPVAAVVQVFVREGVDLYRTSSLYTDAGSTGAA